VSTAFTFGIKGTVFFWRYEKRDGRDLTEWEYVFHACKVLLSLDRAVCHVRSWREMSRSRFIYLVEDLSILLPNITSAQLEADRLGPIWDVHSIDVV
jgi:hypothetical protein